MRLLAHLFFRSLTSRGVGAVLALNSVLLACAPVRQQQSIEIVKERRAIVSQKHLPELDLYSVQRRGQQDGSFVVVSLVARCLTAERQERIERVTTTSKPAGGWIAADGILTGLGVLVFAFGLKARSDGTGDSREDSEVQQVIFGGFVMLGGFGTALAVDLSKYDETTQTRRVPSKTQGLQRCRPLVRPRQVTLTFDDGTAVLGTLNRAGRALLSIPADKLSHASLAGELSVDGARIRRFKLGGAKR